MTCLQDSHYTEAERLRASAVKFAANLRLAQATIMAIDNANQLVANYKKQNDIASESLDMMEENREHLKRVFWTRELLFRDEYCSPEELEQIEDVGRRYAGRLVSTVARQFATQLHELRCNANKYCASAFAKSLQDLALARAQAIANARVLGRMLAFNEIQQRDDLNFDRKLQAAGMGQDLIANAASFMTKGAAGYAQIGQSLTGRLNANFEQIGSAIRQRSLDPGPSSKMRAIEEGVYGQMPYTPIGFASQTPESAIDSNFQVDTSRNGGLREGTGDSVSPWTNQQNQMQMNNGRVGNWDLARTGTVTYTDTDSHGKVIAINVSMEDFELKYVDNKTKGDK